MSTDNDLDRHLRRRLAVWVELYSRIGQVAVNIEADTYTEDRVLCLGMRKGQGLTSENGVEVFYRDLSGSASECRNKTCVKLEF